MKKRVAQQPDLPSLPDRPGPFLTVSQALSAFAQTLTKKNNYVSVVRNYLFFTVEHDLPLGDASRDEYFAWYSKERKLGYNITSPVRKFLDFALGSGIRVVVANSPVDKTPVAVNESIRDYLLSDDNPLGKKTVETYAQALNAFFSWLKLNQQSLSARSVNLYLDDLSSLGRAPATMNLHLSAIKQLARWIVLHQSRGGKFFSEEIVSLHEIQYIKSLRIYS